MLNKVIINHFNEDKIIYSQRSSDGKWFCKELLATKENSDALIGYVTDILKKYNKDMLTSHTTKSKSKTPKVKGLDTDAD